MYLARFSEQASEPYEGLCDVQVKLVIIVQQTSNNKVSFLSGPSLTLAHTNS